MNSAKTREVWHNKAAMKEQRKFNRIQMNLAIAFRSLVDGSTTFASAENFCPGGLCIMAKEKIPAGFKWPFKLETPQGEQFSLKAEVVWSAEWPVLVETEYKMGVKLMDPFSAALAKYSQFYFENSKKGQALKV